MIYIKRFFSGVSSLFREKAIVSVLLILIITASVLMTAIICKGYRTFDMCITDAFVLFCTNGEVAHIIAPIFAAVSLLLIPSQKAAGTILRFGKRKSFLLYNLGRLSFFVFLSTILTICVITLVGVGYSGSFLLTNFASKYGLFYFFTGIKGDVSPSVILLKCVFTILCLYFFTALISLSVDYFTDKKYIAVILVLVLTYIRITIGDKSFGLYDIIDCSYSSVFKPNSLWVVSLLILGLLCVIPFIFARHKEFMK